VLNGKRTNDTLTDRQPMPAGDKRISLLATSIIHEAIAPKTHELGMVDFHCVVVVGMTPGNIRSIFEKTPDKQGTSRKTILTRKFAVRLSSPRFQNQRI